MNSGELFVTGQNEIEIKLHGSPKNVTVKFEGYEHRNPCDQHHDKLTYRVYRDKEHHGYVKHVLKIEWHVSSVRKIHWRVEF